MIIEIFGEMVEVNSEDFSKIEIIEESKIGDTFFIQTKGGYFSCHENFWVPFKREWKINQIVPLRTSL